MAANSPGQQLNDLLVTRNFDPEALDARTGKPPLDDQGAPAPDNADMFTFDWVADSGKNYGTVVCLLGADNNFEVYFGDNLGRGMEFDDKADWYEFLDQLRNFAKRNLLRYDLQNLRRLKYTMAGMAAIKEGLFEGYYGNRKVSYAGEPTQARLMIKHNRTLGENDARFRYVESLFIETAEGEVFKMPFKKLAGGRAMLEHVRHGGTPYDARGQHIVEIVEQINVLSQFRRAHQGRVFEGAAGELVAETTEYLNRLRHNLKAVSNDRGYTQYFESWSPADVSESDLIVEDLKSLFVETRIDPRIEQALPMLARIQKEAQAMKEAEIFESWANRIVEGTWALPETPEQQDELKMLMSQPLVAGADGMNATEQLYGLVGDDELFDIIGEIAVDPDANIWDDERVQNRLEELGVYMVTPAEPAVAAPAAEAPPVAEGEVYDLGKEYGAPAPAKKPRGQDPDDYNPYPYSKEEDDDYFREIFRKKREAKDQGMAEGDNMSTFEEAQCNQTMEGEYCPEHGLAECGNYGMYESELARLKSLASVTNEGWKGTLAGSAAGGIAGDMAGQAVGPAAGAALGGAIGGVPGAIAGGAMGALVGGPVGGAIGGLAGGKIGDKLGGQDVDEEDDPGEKLAGGVAGFLPGALAGLAAGGPVGGLVGGTVGATLGNKIATNQNDSGTPDTTPKFVRETNRPITNIAKDIGATAADVANAPADTIYSAGQQLYHGSDENPGRARGDEDTNEESPTATIVKGAQKAATQGLGDLVSGSGKEVAKNLLAMESNSDSALLARIKSLALFK